MEKATIYSIAEQVGVSASTVSRAFTRPDLVRDQVREKILTAARAVGYHPHLSARRLATGLNNMIGVMMPDITNPFFPPLLRAMQIASAGYGRQLLFLDSSETAGNEGLLIGQLRNQVDGVVIASPRGQRGSLIEACTNLPTVTLNRVLQGVPAIICADEGAIDAATSHLQALGHRHVALVSGPSNSWTSRRRARAVTDAVGRHRLKLASLGHFPATFAGGLSAVPSLTRTKATAVFAFDDVTACGLIAGLKQAGRTVPDDVSVIGCDDVPMAAMLTPPLTTLSAPFDALGQAAVDTVVALISGDQSVPRVRELASGLTVRGTTGRASKPRQRGRGTGKAGAAS